MRTRIVVLNQKPLRPNKHACGRFLEWDGKNKGPLFLPECNGGSTVKAPPQSIRHVGRFTRRCVSVGCRLVADAAANAKVGLGATGSLGRESVGAGLPESFGRSRRRVEQPPSWHQARS